MKNSNNTPATKTTVKSAAVATVKAVFCVPHLVLQSSADLLNGTEALAINAIDGTPIVQSMAERAMYTNSKQMAAVAQAKRLKDMVDQKREQARLAKVRMLKRQLDKAEGVEHIAPSPETIEPAPLPTVKPAEAFNEPAIPSPVVIAPAPPVMEAPQAHEAKTNIPKAKKAEVVIPQAPVAKTTIPKAKKAEVVIPQAHEAKTK